MSDKQKVDSRTTTESSSPGALDPEVEQLLAGASGGSGDDVPDFGDLFEDDTVGELEDVDGAPGKSSSGFSTFHRPEKLEESAKPDFNDKNYYKAALGGEGEVAQRVHGILGQFLNANDPQDRSLYRGKLIPAYWDLINAISRQIHNRVPRPKLLLVRFGVLLPSLLSAEQRDVISRVIEKNSSGEPIYYVDEWLRAVARGEVSASAQDETKVSGKNAAQRVGAVLEKTRGKYDAQLSVVTNLVGEMDAQELLLKEHVNRLTTHEARSDVGPGLKTPYDDSQKTSFSEISSALRRLSNISRDLTRAYSELEDIQSQLGDLKEKESEMDTPAAAVDAKVVAEEMNTIRQMAKLCVGRQGNHFPVLMKQYFRANMLDIGTRENVINVLADVEYLDPEIFQRTFKQQTNRIVPNTILIPTYGDLGICWEPFERFNRATSRGRLAIPMYPKDLRAAIIAALGDLRWQVAKEKAQHYWMEEGLTGWYYQWFTAQKKRGDVREVFVQDYVLWITKESEGTQKLDREVRDVFWRYIPFPQDIKDKLRNRGFVYSELYKKDQNRAASDGY